MLKIQKNITPKQLAIFLAVLVALVSGALTLIFVIMKSSRFVELWLVFVLSIFIIFYIIFFYTLNHLILQRIKPIYKRIHSANLQNPEILEKLEDDDVISIVDKEVRQWAQTKAEEVIELKKQEKYRKEFIGNVSHELKTPIFNIQGYIETLLDGGLEDPGINQRFLQRSKKSINRMIEIVTDLEEISKLESSEYKLQFRNFELHTLILEVIDLHVESASKKNISLKCGEFPGRPIMVNADREKIFQVLSNLIINSIKYGKENGLTQIHVFDMDKHYLVEVEDNGIGIDASEVPRIFERFYRIDKSRSRQAGGTGLGLSIVKHIIESHNQSINCNSEPGKGTSFAFTLRKSNKKTEYGL